MLPVRLTQLSPGEVQRRVIRRRDLTALFLIGDDERSRAWLRQRQAALQSCRPWPGGQRSRWRADGAA